MDTLDNHNMVHKLASTDRDIILIGTAHVSPQSTALVMQVIQDERPDTVCVELCESRYQTILQKNRWQQTDIIKVIKEKKAFLLLSNLLLTAFQKRIAAKLGVKPGEEMIKAIEMGQAQGAHIQLADRDIRITLSRAWRRMKWWDKLKILFQLIFSLGDIKEIDEKDIEAMKKQDVLQSLLADVGDKLPVLRDILIDERDQYLAHRINTAPGKKIVAVVGAGHIPGIKAYWQSNCDLQVLEEIPPKAQIGTVFKYLIPVAIIALIIYGFFHGGKDAGTDMIKWWIGVNAFLAGIGAIIALAHPFTILSSMLAAPLTSLNPMIAAGWVSGLVEAFLRKPKVIDFERLQEDITSMQGFWRNKITRILLVVVFTNLGSAVGTFVAFPLMAKVLS
ncbi:MAG: TraB/GumN family protein [Desulfobacterales bacterium]|nr:TraB/GumN family protein [Desulfobacterales bacterium]